MPSSDDDVQRKDGRLARNDRRRLSRSRSRSKRYRDEERYSHSRSRSRSVNRYRRHRSRRSRSRSSSRYSRHHKSSRRYIDSRSRSRSRSSSQRSYTISRKRQSSSRSPRPQRKVEKKRSRSHSSERYCSQKDKNQSINDGNSSQHPNLEDLPLPDQADFENIDDSQEPIDKERIHREIEEKLRIALAKEGKVYPPKKPEASHPVFANDGSFLEIFKKMQEAQQGISSASTTTATSVYGTAAAPSTSAAAAAAATLYPTTSAAAKPVTQPPLVGRRRGGKILKTGVVAKPKVINNTGDDKDFWSLYLAEVNKYKNNACELNSGNRPLLK